MYTCTHFSEREASVPYKCHTYLDVLETGGLGEAAELGLVGVAEAGLGAGGEERKRGEKYVGNKKNSMIIV